MFKWINTMYMFVYVFIIEMNFFKSGLPFNWFLSSEMKVIYEETTAGASLAHVVFQLVL